jgi:hypothetical protein
VATAADASDDARLLDAFNREFDDPTPGPEVLEERLERLLARDDVFGVLISDPAVGLALMTLRTNVWGKREASSDVRHGCQIYR